MPAETRFTCRLVGQRVPFECVSACRGWLIHPPREGVLDPASLAGGTRKTLSPRPLSKAELNIQTIEWSLTEIEKEGFPHFMLKEIHDQPNAREQALYRTTAEGV